MKPNPRKNRLRATVMLCTAALFVHGCTTWPHYSDALLLKPDAAGKNYQPVAFSDANQSRLYGSNPVFIASDSKFSIRVDFIAPGWLDTVHGSSQKKEEQYFDRPHHLTRIFHKKGGGLSLFLI